MSGFSTAWLDLREPADADARDRDLLTAVAALLAGRDRPLVVDLGSGTGSTFRALAPRLPAGARWRLVDHDPELLAEASARAREAGVAAEALAFDLAGAGPLPFHGADLVTASALFDLCSAAFVEKVAAAAAAARVPLYAALSYDGRMTFNPAHRCDAAAVAAFNRDQRRDKGFGPALGPEAPTALAAALAAAGYDVRIAHSPWLVRRDRAALADRLAEGMAGPIRPVLGGAATDDWLAFRLARSRDLLAWTQVGHFDVLAVPRD